jgi:hypothetical protein
MSDFTDVHTFDTLLKGKYKLVHSKTNEEKKVLFSEFKTKLKDSDAINTLNKIIEDLGNTANYDPTNGMDCSNILTDILCKDDTDIISILEEQLADTTKLGLCPQGRVCRLFQLWKGLYE